MVLYLSLPAHPSFPFSAPPTHDPHSPFNHLQKCFHSSFFHFQNQFCYKKNVIVANILISLSSEIYMTLRFCDIIPHLLPSFCWAFNLCRISLSSDLLWPQHKERLFKCQLFFPLPSSLPPSLTHPFIYTHTYTHAQVHIHAPFFSPHSPPFLFNPLFYTSLPLSPTSSVCLS